MTSADEIKLAIEEHVKGKYPLWTIGLTSDLSEARRLNGYPLIWFAWETSQILGFNIVNFFP